LKNEREPTGLEKTGKHNSAKERIKKKTLIIVQDKVRIKEIAYLVSKDRERETKQLREDKEVYSNLLSYNKHQAAIKYNSYLMYKTKDSRD
jgi:hypothetical protein